MSYDVRKLPKAAETDDWSDFSYAHITDIQISGSYSFIAHPEDCVYRQSIVRLHGYISVLFAHHCDLAVAEQS